MGLLHEAQHSYELEAEVQSSLRTRKGYHQSPETDALLVGCLGDYLSDRQRHPSLHCWEALHKKLYS